MPRCYANPSPTFQPAMRLIAAISQANPCIVTTTFNHQYITGTIVRLLIPIGMGMRQLNEQDGAITVTGPTTFSFPADTTLLSPFVIPMDPPPWQNICAQVVPVGEINETLLASTINVLPL